jgi:hypothetical protein
VRAADNHDLLQLLLFDSRHYGLEVVSPQEMVPEDVFFLGYCGKGFELLVWEGLSASIREDDSF